MEAARKLMEDEGRWELQVEGGRRLLFDYSYGGTTKTTPNTRSSR